MVTIPLRVNKFCSADPCAVTKPTIGYTSLLSAEHIHIARRSVASAMMVVARLTASVSPTAVVLRETMAA